MAEFNQREYQTVVLGTLLCDVEKMLQLGSFGSLDTGGKHPQVSSKFVSAFRDFFSGFADFDLLQTLVQRHHEDPRLGDDLICQNAPNDYKPFSFLVSRAGGVAKRLRARSLQLNLLSDIISHRILHKFNLPLANVLMSSGGKFYMLLPNLSDTKEKVLEIKRETDLWFYRKMKNPVASYRVLH